MWNLRNVNATLQTVATRRTAKKGLLDNQPLFRRAGSAGPSLPRLWLVSRTDIENPNIVIHKLCRKL